jgi:hypothetical protein
MIDDADAFQVAAELHVSLGPEGKPVADFVSQEAAP